MRPLILAIDPRSDSKIKVLSFSEGLSGYFRFCLSLDDTVDFCVAEISSYLKTALSPMEVAHE